MSDQQKRGFLGRLFGGSEPKPQAKQDQLEQSPADEAALGELTAEAKCKDLLPHDEADAFASEAVSLKREHLAPQTEPEPVPEHEPEPKPLPEREPGPKPLPDREPGLEPDPDEAPGYSPEPVREPEPKPGILAATAEAAPVQKRGFFQRLREGLFKTSSKLTDGITSVFTKRKLDDQTLEDLEDLLIQADLGLDVSARITAALRKARYNTDITAEEVRELLAAQIEKILEPVAHPLVIDPAHRPHVILMVGVNGTGKTTTIGKYARQFRDEKLKVMLAAGDTFRAAAIEQLEIWGERTGAAVVAREPGADAAGLAFDALKQAQDEGYDVLLIDTAGRLQNKAVLMAELEKVVRVIKKFNPEAPHTVLLSLDATTGQNALNQVEIFGKTSGVTGLVMTKLDGTARGGILVAIASKFGLPVHAIGVGEGAGDLEAFKAADFARAIAGLNEIKSPLIGVD